MPNLVEIIKQAAVEAIESTMPMGVYFGKVTSRAPLKVRIEQKLTLEAADLLLTESVSGQKALTTGEKVILLRVQGGQSYVVLDRVR